MAAQLWTIGYEAFRTPPELLAPLVEAGVERLVDVRELPLSRRAGFSKRALGASAEEAGIAYVHAKVLGTPAAIRPLFRTKRDLPEGHRRYRGHLDEPEVAIALDALADDLARVRLVLMCVEAEPEGCHRSLLVEALHERVPALTVTHLGLDGPLRGSTSA